jgi:hypothetical protein
MQKNLVAAILVLILKKKDVVVEKIAVVLAVCTWSTLIYSKPKKRLQTLTFS